MGSARQLRCLAGSFLQHRLANQGTCQGLVATLVT